MKGKSGFVNGRAINIIIIISIILIIIIKVTTIPRLYDR